MKPDHLATFMVLLLAMAPAVQAQTKENVKAGERTSVDLTIYNQNLSLIREERPMNLPKGESHVIIPEIPATIDGTSLHFSSLTDAVAVRVLEQSYQYDLVSRSKLLEKYLGKEIQFGSTVGKLLAAGSGQDNTPNVGIVAEINGKIEINPPGQLILPDLPEGLIVKPQLEWLVSNTHEGEQRAEISYMAGQLSWVCDYVALLNKDDSKLDITGWVTLTNNSGTSFKDAGLKLVAGDVNLVRQEFDNMRMAKGVMVATQADQQPQFKQTELFEYKLYTLQRHTDLNNDETKQIELTSGKNVSARKVFIYDGIADQWRAWYHDYSYRSQGSFGQQSNPKVGVFVIFKNEERAGLGIPMPKGRVRVYKRDDDGKEQFVGEDQIDHTPKDEELRLYLGNAFDIVGERAQKDFRSFASGKVVEETIEIKVRNHKKEPVDVQIYEHPWRWSEWEITKSSAEWTKVDQSTVKFPVTIGKDGEKVVTYAIRYSW